MCVVGVNSLECLRNPDNLICNTSAAWTTPRSNDTTAADDDDDAARSDTENFVPDWRQFYGQIACAGPRGNGRQAAEAESHAQQHNAEGTTTHQ